MADQSFDRPSPWAEGQRLECPECGAEIEIVRPCPCDPPEQVFRCCGHDMVPSQGTAPRLASE